MKHTKIIIASLTAAILLVFAVSGFSWPRHHGHPVPLPTTSSPAPTPTSTAGTALPSPPSGWVQTYSHNFVTQGETGWSIQNAGATVTDSTQPGAEFGLGIGMTAETNQYAEAIMTANKNIVTPSTWVQELVYAPAASNGETANWPAWWTTGQNWPADGEIDMLEGQSGASCEQTHYGTSGEINSPSHCHQGNGTGTGWTTITMLRQNGEVQEWYGSTYVGEVALPTSADEELIFQNQDAGSGISCPNCVGPYTASTAWLSKLSVYSPS